MNWSPLETNTHQDHVIAHVIGTTVLGTFTWDETLYLLLDIGFIWNVYLDAEMGLLPHPVAINELDSDDTFKTNLRTDVDVLLQDGDQLSGMQPSGVRSPIKAVDLFEDGSDKRLEIVCEEGVLIIQTSLDRREIEIVTKFDSP
jgi:hypothetical protein